MAALRDWVDSRDSRSFLTGQLNEYRPLIKACIIRQCYHATESYEVVLVCFIEYYLSSEGGDGPGFKG